MTNITTSKITPIEKAICALMDKGLTRTQARTRISEFMGFHRNNITNIINRGGDLPKTNILGWVELTGLSIEELFPKKTTK